jgi:hypothetical protein
MALGSLRPPAVVQRLTSYVSRLTFSPLTPCQPAALARSGLRLGVLRLRRLCGWGLRP